MEKLVGYLPAHSRVLSSGVRSVQCAAITPSHHVARHLGYFLNALPPPGGTQGEELHPLSMPSAACDCSWLVGIKAKIRAKIRARCSGSVNPNAPTHHRWVMHQRAMEGAGWG